MKILIIDDQKLVLITLKRFLVNLGYFVKTADNMSEGIIVYDTYKPDLVITDIDMPVIPNSSFEIKCLDYIKKKSGLEIIKHIRIIKKKATPIMVLSGNENAKMISKASLLGADDYMVKPLSLDEIALRLEKLLGICMHQQHLKGGAIIEKTCIGIVVPFDSNSNTTDFNQISDFLDLNCNVHVCLVGPTNNVQRLSYLQKIQETEKQRISILNFEDDVTKIQAIRLGMLHLEQLHQFESIGYMDGNSLQLSHFKKLMDNITKASSPGIAVASQEKLSCRLFGFDMQRFIRHQKSMFLKQRTAYADLPVGMAAFNTKFVTPIFTKLFKSESKMETEIIERIKEVLKQEGKIDLVSQCLISNA